MLNKRYTKYIQSLPQINLYLNDTLKIKKIIGRLVELEINLFRPSGTEYTFNTAFNAFYKM